MSCFDPSARTWSSVSPASTCSATENLELSPEDRPGYLFRGSSCTTYEADRVCTGFSFGSQRTTHIIARIYDKTAEMEAKGTDWWGAVWAERHVVGTKVWRIEFEIGRAALSELDLSNPAEVLAAVPSLWRYCSSEWLTLRRPTSDSNRSRWPLDERWHAVQSASLVHDATELTAHSRDQAAKAHRVLRAIMNAAVDDELIGRNPCNIRGAGIERTRERQLLDTRTVLELAEAIIPRLRGLVLLGGFGGLRTGELLGLQRQEVDLLNGTVGSYARLTRSRAEGAS